MAARSRLSLRPLIPADPHRRMLAWLLLATFLTGMAGWLFKAHCTFDDGGWTAAEQYTTGCYSDAMPFWGARDVAAGKVPYLQSRIEYPVLTGALIYVEGRLTVLLFGAQAGPAAFLFVVTVANVGLAMVVTWLLWGMGLAASRLWAWALAPPLVLYAGHNWDMLAIALAVGALAVAASGRARQAVALAAAGGAAKLFPVLLLPLIALPALAERRWRDFAVLVATACGVWLALNLPVALLAWDNWAEFYQFSQERGGTLGASWDVLQSAGLLSTEVPARNRWSAILFIAGAIAIIAAGWRAHARAPWMLAAPIIGWFLLVNKVWSPQFDLWVYPLMLVALPRLWPLGLFAGADAWCYFAEFWNFAGMEGQSPSAGPEMMVLAATVRAAVMLWIIWCCVAGPPPPLHGSGAGRSGSHGQA